MSGPSLPTSQPSTASMRKATTNAGITAFSLYTLVASGDYTCVVTHGKFFAQGGRRVRIKKIEISGFKSFCERTLLTFSQPITAIVGPNGCGKSNVVDAIRWCMGEQSAKHLRGKDMQDVIFAGSDSRGP